MSLFQFFLRFEVTFEAVCLVEKRGCDCVGVCVCVIVLADTGVFLPTNRRQLFSWLFPNKNYSFLNLKKITFENKIKRFQYVFFISKQEIEFEMSFLFSKEHVKYIKIGKYNFSIKCPRNSFKRIKTNTTFINLEYLRHCRYKNKNKVIM